MASTKEVEEALVRATLALQAAEILIPGVSQIMEELDIARDTCRDLQIESQNLAGSARYYRQAYEREYSNNQGWSIQKTQLEERVEELGELQEETVFKLDVARKNLDVEHKEHVRDVLFFKEFIKRNLGMAGMQRLVREAASAGLPVDWS